MATAQSESRQRVTLTASLLSGEDRIRPGRFRKCLMAHDLWPQVQSRQQLAYVRLLLPVVMSSHLLSPLLSHWDKRNSQSW